jgi:hypothetical protein
MNVIKEAEDENRDTFMVQDNILSKQPQTTKNKKLNKTKIETLNNQMKFTEDSKD